MIFNRLAMSASLSKWEFALICDFYWQLSHLCNVINYPADIQRNLGYDIQIVPTHICCSITQSTYREGGVGVGDVRGREESRVESGGER